ncbi:hypothetical protein SteCoe_10818 [Stentor coeruleus]|uniref:Derlin n=1 Tax=Stentor coeruleus TaxID=5963 RepID=A0A1R2CEN4_9CILI|nr:hypothetical protein SteCoe_10818 [Stentor coeruleus]
MSSNGSRTDICVKIKDWWDKMPLFTFYIFWISSILCILSYSPPYSVHSLYLSYENFADRKWFWTLLTYPYQPSGILITSISLYLYTTTTSESERFLGTSRYIIFFGYYIINIGLLYLGLIYLLKWISSTLFAHFSIFPFFGIWPIIMIELVLKYNKNPQSYIKFLCSPCQIQSQYFPWIFFFWISVFLISRFWEMLLGIIIGHLHLTGYMNWILIPNCLVSKLEITIFRPLVKFSRYAFAECEDVNIQRPRANEIFVPFSGTGNRLGEVRVPENEPPEVAMEKIIEDDEYSFNTA